MFHLGYRCSSTSAKRHPPRRSTRKSIDLPPPSTLQTEDISDDDILLVDIYKRKSKPIDTLFSPSVSETNIPLATNLRSMPGHSPDDARDTRFLGYSDLDTLSTHFQTSLLLDRQSFSALYGAQRKRFNCLHKIFKLHFLKTLKKTLQLERKDPFLRKQDKSLPFSVMNSSTSASFQTDWSINRRQSVTNAPTPRNFFHMLQLNPRKQLSSSHTTTARSSSSNQNRAQQNFEQMKDLLARTYYPHVYTAMEYGYRFGSTSKFPNTHDLLTVHDEEIIHIKQSPDSPIYSEAPTATPARSVPLLPVATKQDLDDGQRSPIVRRKRGRPPKIARRSFSPIPSERCSSDDNDDLSSTMMRKPVVVLTPPSIALPSPPFNDEGTEPNKHRKRKPSSNGHNHVHKRAKRKDVSPTLSEFVDALDDSERYERLAQPRKTFTFDSSDADWLPSQPPKQHFIKNGLRSNYYKRTTPAPTKYYRCVEENTVTHPASCVYL